MLHPHETTKDSATKYAEARRVWQSASEVALWDAALTEGKAQPIPVLAAPKADEGEDTVTFRSYGTARDSLIASLLEDASAHEAGRFDEIGRRADHIELPSDGPAALTNLRVALTFWDGWIDARNGGWQPDGTIAKAEWPMFARRIASDLAEGREISDARVGAHLDAAMPRYRPQE
jgi:hypothetical protein